MTILQYSLAIAKRFPEYFDCAEQSYILSNKIISHLADKYPSDNDLLLTERIVNINFYRSMESFLSVVNLADRGLCSDAYALTRKLLEILITLKYIDGDSGKRSEMYWDFIAISQYRRVRSAIEDETSSKLLKSGLNRMMPKIELEYRKVRDKYSSMSDEDFSKKFRFKWSGKTMKEMADAAGLETDYKKFYGSFSTDIHTSSEGIDRIIRRKSNGVFSFGPSSTVGDMLFVILIATRFFTLILEHVVHVNDLMLRGELETIYKILTSLETRLINSPESEIVLSDLVTDL